jgi:hypothetical protein
MRKAFWVPLLLLAVSVPAALLIYQPEPPTEVATVPPVNPNSAPAQPRVVALAVSLGCPTDKDTFACLDELAEDVYEADGMDALVATISSWQAEVKPDGLPCHGLMHRMGKKVAESVSLEAVTAESRKTAGICANGFFHGAIEGVALSLTKDKLPPYMQEFCQSIPELGDDCAHSAGHALAIRNAEDVHQALQGCSSFSEPESVLCSSGVFMTFGRGLPGFEDGNEEPWITYTPQTARTVCFDVEDRYAEHCWFMLWMAYTTTDALGGVTEYQKVCTQLDAQPTSKAFENCYRGLGMLYDNRGAVSTKEAATKCPSSKDQRYWCVFSLGWSVMYDHVITFNTKDGYETACSTLEEIDRPACEAGEAFVQMDGGLL